MNDNFILQKMCPMGGNFILDPIFAGKDKWITNLEINACSDDHTLIIFVRKKSKNCNVCMPLFIKVSQN